jgi:RNA:NAD 2'-phosphotransferase (TPT1/KptA family)
MDAAGYILVDDIILYLKGKGFKDMNFAIIQEVVETNDKKRF